MSRREIPQEWRVLLDRKGIPSARALGEKAGLSHVSVIRVIFGDKKFPTEDTLQKIATALEVDMPVVYALAGRSVQHAEKWDPPAESARLNAEQRAVLEQLIRVMAGEEGAQAQDAPGAPHSNVHELRPQSRAAYTPDDVPEDETMADWIAKLEEDHQ